MPHPPPPIAGRCSSTLAVQQRGTAQPRLTLPISAQALVSHMALIQPVCIAFSLSQLPHRVCHL